MSTGKPSVSVVVNTTDRAGPLRTLLRALEHQSYTNFEVIVVVGPTRDDTLEMLSAYDDRVCVLRCPRANLSQSRNIGLKATRGDIVAYIDDDAVPCRNWLQQLVRLFEDEAVDGTGGIVYLIHPNQPIIQHRIGIVSSLAEQHDVRSSWLDQFVPEGEGLLWTGRMMGTNMAYRRRALLEIGGFDEFYEWVYDDTDVAVRLANAGKVVHPVSEARVYHVPASSRNRVAQTYLGKWWVQTKASIYFSIKNGREGGESWRTIVERNLQLIHGHWLWTGQLWNEERITFSQMLNMRWNEGRSAAIGMGVGYLGKRTLIPGQTAKMNMEHHEPIRPFQNEASAKQPTVDPISGDRPTISMPNDPLRIALLSKAYPPQQSEGVGRHTSLMARGLFELGHTVHVVAHGERDQIAFIDGAYVHRIPYRLERYPRFQSLPNLHHALNYSHAVYNRVKSLLLNDGIQVTDSPVWQFDGLVTALDGICPVVVRPQTALRQIGAMQRQTDDDVRLMGDMEQRLIEEAAYLAPNSLATVAALHDVYGLEPDSIPSRIIPHGIVPVGDEAVRPFDVDNPPEVLTVLYVGRLEKRKGILALFDAMPTVLEDVPNARFVIAGSDNSRADGFLTSSGLDYPAYFASQYPHLADRVSFLGRVSDEELDELYQSCDLFVAPSLYESFGLIYLEAMNYAKPVIGGRAGGIPEVVDDGVTGILVEPDAAAPLAEAICSLVTSPTRLREMGLAGRQRLLDKFTYIQMASAFAQVYRQVIGASIAGSDSISTPP